MFVDQRKYKRFIKVNFKDIAAVHLFLTLLQTIFRAQCSQIKCYLDQIWKEKKTSICRITAFEFKFLKQCIQTYHYTL